MKKGTTFIVVPGFFRLKNDLFAAQYGHISS